MRSAIENSGLLAKARAVSGRHYRSLAGVALGMLAWMGLWVGAIWGQLGSPHPDNAWVKGAYEVKAKAVARIQDHHKALLVGGSATMFGVDSALLSEGLGLPVANAGVNAGLGAYVVPREVDRFIAAGDIVVMPLEYRLLLWDGVPSYVTLSWALEHPETLRYWRITSLLNGLWSLPFARVQQGYGDSAFDAESWSRAGPYGPHKLSKFGDQVDTAAKQRTRAQWEAIESLAPERYDELYADTTLGLDEWAFWWERWQQRGACLVVVPPPFMKVAVYESTQYREFFDQIPKRVERRGVTYLGHPSDAFFTVEGMFDTNYHLTAESRRIYTEWLLETLLSSNVKCLATHQGAGTL